MNDLVFRCPSCKHPLMVGETAAGKRIECPHCNVNILVPRVRTGILTGKGKDPCTLAARQIRQIGRLEKEVASTLEGLASLSRRLPDQQNEVDRFCKTAALVNERLRFLSGHLESGATAAHAAHAAGEGEASGSRLSDASNPWRKRTLVLGGLAFVLACLAAVL